MKQVARRIILSVIAAWTGLAGQAQVDYSAAMDDVIADIYSFLSESGETDYEELHTLLTDIAANPINLNLTTADELRQLRFLSDRQIDAILLYVHRHPMESVSELRLIPGLPDYDIRNLLPFVCVLPSRPEEPIYFREVFTQARHEILARADVRYAEYPHKDKQLDPFYTRLRYKFNFRNQVQAGFTFTRPTGSDAKGLEYGGYVQLSNIRHLATLVAGNFQAQFGLGLVCSSPFHTGKSGYVLNAASASEGLRKYASTDGNGLHGIGATLRWEHIDVSAWYSLTRENDSIRRHVAGTNLTLRYRRWKAGVTAMEKIYSDSLRYYYENARYNQHYFRGDKQFVGGLNVSFSYGMADVFAEAATAQNRHRWGYGIIAGTRLTPVPDIGLILLYRYYSPYFDNTLGYAFSETSRINDENGGYIGIEVKNLKHWRLTAYGDVFYFSGIKYGIPYRPSYGYDVQAEAAYLPSEWWQTSLRFRAKEKAKKNTYSLRYMFICDLNSWHLKTQADATLVSDSTRRLTYGLQAFQDIRYTFPSIPLTLQLRLQGFYIPQWDNRIYAYENDVLYGYSVPAAYGEGGKFVMNVRWQIIRQLTLYLKVSETLYSRRWKEQRHLPGISRTDVHLLLRASL